MKIIFRIKEERNKQGNTLKILSKKTGISITHLNDIENHIKMPSFIMVVLIADALKIEIKELYTVKW